MVTILFIFIAAMTMARADIQKARLRSNETTFTIFVASLCLAVVCYFPIFSPLIDFVLYFFEYVLAYDIGFLLMRNAPKRSHT